MGAWRQKLSDCGQAKAAELIEQSGLKVSHLLWAGGFTGSDGRTYRESVEDALEAIRTAARLRTQTLVVYSGARAGHTYNHARRLIQSALEELIPAAAEAGVTLAVEPMHPGCAGGCTFLTSVDDVLQLLGAVGSSQVKMVLDTYHLGQDPGFVERIGEIASHVAIVQLGDARQPPDGEQNRCRLGEGNVPLSEIIAALKAAGYDGYYDVELLGEEIEPADYRALLEHAKEAFERLVVGA
jgi:sugar phosphate isomerase/epimerase